MKHKWLFILSWFVILLIFGLQVHASFFKKNELMDIKRPLENYLTSKDWEIIPLGNNENEVNNAKKILNFTEAIYYKKNNINLYMAYWEPGKMPYNTVGLHSPDVCWVETGWTKKEKGVFYKDGEYRYVKFCHLIGDEVSDYNYTKYETTTKASLLRYYQKFKDLFKYGFKTKKDQLIIRIDSNLPLENNNEYTNLLKKLYTIKGFKNYNKNNKLTNI